MEIGKYSILVTLFISIFACGQLKHNTSSPPEYDVVSYAKIVTQNGRTDTLFVTDSIPRNPIIFVADRKYTYIGTYIANNKDTISRTNIDLLASNNRLESNYTTNQMDVQFVINYDPADSVKHSPYSHNKTFSYWADTVHEGIIENIQQVWIHPIRFNQFLWTETIAYPQCMLPLSVNKSWTGQTTIPTGTWGDWQGATISNQYTVVGKQNFELEGKVLDCWEVQCTSELVGAKAHLNFLFHEDFGFVQMHYTHYSGDQVWFDMVGYSFN